MTAGAEAVGPMWPSGSPFPTVPSLLPALIAGVYLVVTLGWYSRLLEHQADLCACSYLRDTGCGAGSNREAVARYVRALEKISLAQRANRHRGGWLHPSLQSRIDFLRDTALDPTRETVFHRRVRRTDAIVLAGAPIALALLLAVSFPA
jgi:Zn-dependent protease with chaperone function